MDPDEGERLDAHGITGGAVQDLRIINTDIHTFSGDAIQFDPNRAAPGWNNIHIEGCRFWLEPLEELTAGFLIGQVTGENAIDTKTYNDADEAQITIIDTEAWGFRDGLDISNQAAFLFKENVKVTLSRVHVHNSEIAFRVRGPTSARPKGATVHMENILVHDVDVGIRYEDELENLTIWHATFGAGIENIFEEADSETTNPEVLNTLFYGEAGPEGETDPPSLPSEANPDGHNMLAQASDFVDALAGDHHLVGSSAAIDAANVISGVSTDLDGMDRIIGPAPDVGAYEYTGTVLSDTGSVADTGEETEDTDTPDPTTPDEDATTLEEDDGVRGIGAAEQVGEKGGCGCHATRIPPFMALWIFLGLIISSRRSPKNQTGQSAP